MGKALLLLKTTGLEYDDRIRKECNSLAACGVEPVIAVLDDSNQKRSGLTHYNTRYHAVSLWSRKLLPSARGLFFKTAELLAKLTPMVIREKPDVLWIHNIEMMGMVLVAGAFRKTGLVKRVVWDHHELPPDGYLDNALRWSVLRMLMALCDAHVSANQERLDLLAMKLGNDCTRRFHVLQNFPDEEFCQLPTGTLPEHVAMWLDGIPYLITQGGADNDRRLKECVEAVVRFGGSVKLVVVGRYTNDLVSELRARWKQDFHKIVFFTGMVPQMKMVDYIDHAFASIVFYERTMRNSWLCAPNRLYQAIARGIPVITGCNPPLANFVRRTGAGVLLQGDGEDVGDIVNGIEVLMGDRSSFATKARLNRTSSLWQTQDATVALLAAADRATLQNGDPNATDEMV